MEDQAGSISTVAQNYNICNIVIMSSAGNIARNNNNNNGIIISIIIYQLAPERSATNQWAGINIKQADVGGRGGRKLFSHQLMAISIIQLNNNSAASRKK